MVDLPCGGCGKVASPRGTDRGVARHDGAETGKGGGSERCNIVDKPAAGIGARDRAEACCDIVLGQISRVDLTREKATGKDLETKIGTVARRVETEAARER